MSFPFRTSRHRTAHLAIAGTAVLAATLAAGLLAADKRPNEKRPTKERPVGRSQERSPRVAQKEADPPAANPDEHPFNKSLRAPALDGGVGWINTAGPIDLQQLRGKFVLLDFWTYCCINCMHILPELKKLEHAYPNEIVVIGVHSAKFETEQDTKNIQEAVLRNEIEHPVINDARHVIWDKFEVQSWPTLCVIDPEGNLVARNSGEIDFETLDKFFKRVMPYYERKGLLDKTPLRFELESYKAEATPLRFPGKVLADEDSDRLFIADSNHNRIVVTKLDGTLIETIGSGQIGAEDGPADKASFDHPQGMALVKDTLYVADTENHLLRSVDLKKKIVKTIAGTGKQGHGWPGMETAAEGAATRTGKHRWVGPPLKTALNSPWALWVQGRDLYIAMAGPHQIWKMPLGRAGEIGPFAGNGAEDIVDGPLLPDLPYGQGFAAFAQPSGLASDGKQLFVADSEGSSIRAVPFNVKGSVTTLLGTASLPAGRLFTFGDVDGQGRVARLQHPLDVLFHDGKLYIADTYNNKIKVLDPETTTLTTLVGTGQSGAEDMPAAFDEPAGLALAGGKLYVADTNNHAIRTIDLKAANKVGTLAIKGLTAPAPKQTKSRPTFHGAAEVDVPPTKVKLADGKVRLHVALELPEGYKINPDAPMRYLIEAVTPSGPIARDAIGKLTDATERAPTFDIDLPAAIHPNADRLTVSLAYYYCQTGSEGVCKAGNVIWTVPVQVTADATEAAAPLTYKVE